MLKTKYALSALGLLVAMTMATDALAQGVFSVSSSIVPRARANGHTELAGGVTLARAASPIGDAGWDCNDRLRRDDHQRRRRRRRDEHHPSGHLRTLGTGG